jgi:hypothetical protein
MEALNTNFTFRCFFALVDEALSHHKFGNEGGNCFEAIEREVMKSTRRSVFLGVERTSSSKGTKKVGL